MCVTDVYIHRPPLRHKIISRASRCTQSKRGKQVPHRVLCGFSFVSKSHKLGHCADGEAHWDVLMERRSLEIQQPFSYLWIYEQLSGIEMILPKQNGVTVSALGVALVHSLAWRPVTACSSPGFVNEPQQLSQGPAVVKWCVHCVSSPQLLTCCTGGTSSRLGSCLGASYCCSFPWPSSALWASWPTWPWPHSRPPSVSASTSLFYKLCRKPTRATLSSEFPSQTSPCPASHGTLPLPLFHPCALWVMFLWERTGFL